MLDARDMPANWPTANACQLLLLPTTAERVFRILFPPHLENDHYIGISKYQRVSKAWPKVSFSYYERGSHLSNFLILIMAVILLIALLSFKARYRALLERFALQQGDGE